MSCAPTRSRSTSTRWRAMLVRPGRRPEPMAQLRLSRRDFAQGGAAAVGLTLSRRAQAAPGGIEKARLTFGIPVDAASFLPVYVAVARTFKEQGLTVELTSFRGDAEVAQAL